MTCTHGYRKPEDCNQCRPLARAEAERELLAACEWAVVELKGANYPEAAERLRQKIAGFREVTGQ